MLFKDDNYLAQRIVGNFPPNTVFVNLEKTKLLMEIINSAFLTSYGDLSRLLSSHWGVEPELRGKVTEVYLLTERTYLSLVENEDDEVIALCPGRGAGIIKLSGGPHPKWVWTPEGSHSWLLPLSAVDLDLWF